MGNTKLQNFAKSTEAKAHVCLPRYSAMSTWALFPLPLCVRRSRSSVASNVLMNEVTWKTTKIRKSRIRKMLTLDLRRTSLESPDNTTADCSRFDGFQSIQLHDHDTHRNEFTREKLLYTTKHNLCFPCCAVKSCPLVNDCDLLAAFSDFYLHLSHLRPSISSSYHLVRETRTAGLQSGEGLMMMDSVVWAQYINVTATSPQQTPRRRTGVGWQ